MVCRTPSTCWFACLLSIAMSWQEASCPAAATPSAIVCDLQRLHRPTAVDPAHVQGFLLHSPTDQASVCWLALIPGSFQSLLHSVPSCTCPTAVRPS